MNFYQHPDCYSELRQLYWKLRNRRAYDLARRQWCYRRIRKERARLVAAGHSAEHVRLYCRWMANPSMRSTELRLVAYERSVAEYAIVLGKIRGGVARERMADAKEATSARDCVAVIIRGTNTALAPILPSV